MRTRYDLSATQPHAPLPTDFGDGIPLMTRRQALLSGLIGTAGLLLGGNLRLGAEPVAAAPGPVASRGPVNPKAKSIIQIWMWGGPAHLETFDPKPEAGNDYCGPFTSPIATKTAGLKICELLPLLAQQSDKYSVIRSMSHGINGHETAAYLVQTGREAGDGLVYPSVGSVVSLFKGYEAGYRGQLPPYIVLTELQGRFSESGFLGSRAKPFATGGDPAQNPFLVEGVVAQGISTQRQEARRQFLGNLDTLGTALHENAQMAAAAEYQKQAYDMILGDAGKVFDLSLESDAMRERYGRNTFGQSCLMARRLVEKGVPFVTINYKGWDTHKQHFQIMRRKLPEMDRGLAALLQDLSERGLLDSTIVWWGGEFGRTPKVLWEPPWNGGRGHWGGVFSCLVAGGGFKGGHVIGASDSKGESVTDRPVHPSDLIASMYSLAGIDPKARLPHPQGKEVSVMPSANEAGNALRPLTEIM